MIKKIFMFIKRKKEIFRGFIRDAEYMDAGIYEYDASIKYISKGDQYTKQRTFQLFQNNYYQLSVKLILFFLRKTLFRKKISIHESSNHFQDFCGTVYRPVRSTNGYTDSKIFDLSRNEVLSIFSERNNFQSVIGTYEYFKDFFPMPNILRSDDEKLLIVEELVIFEQNHTWEEEDYKFIISDIFNRYRNYFKKYIEKENISYTNPMDYENSQTDNREIQFIFEQVDPKILAFKFPCLRIHGDLWTANTLLVKGDKPYICYIDWEYSKEYSFFYDFFHLIWLEVYVNNNSYYIESFAKGEYDQYFKDIFNLFDLDFNEHHRIDYLHIYFLNFYNQRLAYLSKMDRWDFINKYKRIIEKIRNTVEMSENSNSKHYINMDM